ncbi:MAG TPA: sel1 repeat family protein [Candidatus Mediterraneibacter merdipullorum]|nr:sel1 repeat family protein [Candidatus Mediterraneibacter merdipullorum]
MVYEELENSLLQLLNEGNWDMAQDLLFEEQKQGNPDATAVLGEFFYEGIGYEKDILKAKQLFESAFQSGSARGAYLLGRLYDYGNEFFAEDQAKAQYYYEIAEGGGDKDAVFMLASRYMEGKNVERSDEKAFKLFKKGADAGNIGCMENIGVFYEFGVCTKQDLETAIYWYRQVLKNETENDFCMYRLASCLINTNPTGEILEEVYELTRKAIDLGNIDAYFILALLYEDGRVVTQDYDMAQKYMKLAADNGCELAMDNLNRYKRDIFGHYYV